VPRKTPVRFTAMVLSHQSSGYSQMAFGEPPSKASDELILEFWGGEGEGTYAGIVHHSV
jgi:hypothetical protein